MTVLVCVELQCLSSLRRAVEIAHAVEVACQQIVHDNSGALTKVLFFTYESDCLPEGTFEQLDGEVIFPRDLWGNDAPLWECIAEHVKQQTHLEQYTKIVVLSGGTFSLRSATASEAFVTATQTWRKMGKRVELYHVGNDVVTDKLFDERFELTGVICTALVQLERQRLEARNDRMRQYIPDPNKSPQWVNKLLPDGSWTQILQDVDRPHLLSAAGIRNSLHDKSKDLQQKLSNDVL